MSVKCLITGCKLVLSKEGVVIHGDLHQVGDAFVFNSVMGTDGRALREYTDCEKVMHSEHRALEVTEEYFERRGVFVFTDVMPNPTAFEYVREAFS